MIHNQTNLSYTIRVTHSNEKYEFYHILFHILLHTRVFIVSENVVHGAIVLISGNTLGKERTSFFTIVYIKKNI